MNIIRELPTKVTVTNQTVVSLDVEIYGMDASKLHRPTGTFACLSVCFDSSEDVYVIQDKMWELNNLFKLIEPAKYFVGHNLAFDLNHLRRWVEIKQRPVWCTMLVEKILWGGYYGLAEFGLNDLCRRYLDLYLPKDLQKSFGSMDYMTDQMIEYAAKDAYYTMKCYEAQQKEIAKRGYDMNTYWQIDEPTLWAVLDFQPVKVNVARWLGMAKEFEERGIAMQNDLGVNVYSHTQVKEFVKKTTGIELKDTQEETLVNIKGKAGDVIDKILLIRQLRKASSTYGEKWIQNYVEEDGLVYASFNVIGTETGRFSSSNPNLQQLPARKIPEYRQLIISRKGKLIIADIQAQEPRILAYLSGDKNLRKAFDDKVDVHLAVARTIFNEPEMKKSDSKREIGKMVNLATSYGLSAKGLSIRLGITEDEANDFLHKYFANYPGVSIYIDRMRSQAHRFEYVESISGRRIWMNRWNYQVDNNAINSPIQASAADLLKLWLTRMHLRCIIENIPFEVTMVIHDEIVLDVPIEQVGIYKTMLKETFDEAAKQLFGDMPFEIDLVVGKSWAAKKLGEEE